MPKKFDINSMKEMKECFEILQYLSDFCDNQIDDKTKNKIINHLQDCKNCEKFGREFSGLLAKIKEIKNINPLESGKLDILNTKILERIRDATKK